MTGYQMKKKTAAVLAAMMLSSCMPFGVLAEENTQQDAPLIELVELIVPISVDLSKGGEAVEQKREEPEKVPERSAPEKMEPQRKEEPLIQAVELIVPITRQDAQQSADPIEPVTPVAPVEPAAPVAPVEPAAPVAPVEPAAPVAPVEPAAPVAPVEPAAPVAPVEPAAPVAPVEPAAPVAPVEPAAPVAPADTSAEYAPFDMHVTVKDGIITVKVSGASDGKMIAIEVKGNGVKEFNGILTSGGKGSGELGKLDEDTEEFVALDPGTYTVRAYYESKESVEKKTTVVIEDTSSGDDDVQQPDAPVDPPAGDSNEGSDEDAGTGDSGTGNGGYGDGESGGTQPVDPVDPPVSDEAEGVKAFTILPVVTDGSIAVVIDGASSREIEIRLIDKDGKTVGMSAIIGNGLVQLGRFASGTYSVQAQYVTPVVGADGSYDYKRVSAQAIVPEGVSAPDKIEAIDIQAKIEKGKDYIIITVTNAADIEMMVSVDGLGDKAITKGGSVRYDGLTPGETYAVEIDYINYVEGARKYAATVTIDKPVTLGEIKITKVTQGTNMLTVYGTATAGQQIILTTTPAAASDVYAMADADGNFKAEIACSAGTYTAVTAKYTADTAKVAYMTGNWVVAAPAVKPSLSIDSIDSASTTVVGKTTAGIVVEIKAHDYTQKVTADNGGVIRFSLPHAYGAGTEFTFVVYYGDGLSFTQTAKVVEAAYVHTLEYGWEGDAVRKLTARLEKLGYPVKETSRYGSTVREAVRLFQVANGLKANGIADPNTQKAIFSVGAIPYGSSKYPTLVRGDKGMALIYTLQQRLKDLGYYTIKVDGIFGSGTQRAVREFQRVNGLTVTGKADHATQALLYSSAAKSASYAITGDYKTLSRSGKYKSAVVPLQKRLRALGYYSGNIDGYFGSQTYRAVRNFQSRNGLTVTGVADPYTQQVLYSASAKTYSGSTASSGVTSSGYRLLYWGCRGEAVTRLQSALINAGYKSIVRKADGIFGQWTYDAVRAYQKDHGLAVDGIAGKNTQNKLYGTNY